MKRPERRLEHLERMESKLPEFNRQFVINEIIQHAKLICQHYNMASDDPHQDLRHIKDHEKRKIIANLMRLLSQNNL